MCHIDSTFRIYHMIHDEMGLSQMDHVFRLPFTGPVWLGIPYHNMSPLGRGSFILNTY